MNVESRQGDLLQAPTVDPMQVELESLRRQCRLLRLGLWGLCAILLLFVLGVDLFLAKQVRMARAQLIELRPQVDRATREFQQVREPNMRAFIAQLTTFAETNRDLQPILERYRPFFGRYYPVVSPISPEPGLPLAPK